MKWNDDRSATLIAEFHMATPLANQYKANLLERSNYLLARNNGQCGTHAGSRTVVIIGGSSESGRSSPSKYKPSASSRFTSASSILSP